MDRVLIVIKLTRRAYKKTLQLGRTVHDGLVVMNAVYTTPNPTLAAFDAQLDIHETNCNNWRSGTTHGTTSDKLAVQASTLVVQSMLKQLAFYCMDVTPDDGVNFTAVGWDIKSVPVPLGAPGPISNLHQSYAESVGAGEIKLLFKRPDGATAFNIFHSAGNVITIPPDKTTFLTTVQTASFKDTGLIPGSEHAYVIVPVGSVPSSSYVGAVFRAK